MNLDLGFTSIIESLVEPAVWYTTLDTARRDTAGASMSGNQSIKININIDIRCQRYRGILFQYRAGHPSSCLASNSVSLTMNLLHVGRISLVVVF